MTTTETRSAWRFFMDSAGYATPPGRTACALELARAEQWRRFEEQHERLSVEWMDDEAADLSWADAATLDDIRAGRYDVLGCVVTYREPLGWSGASLERCASLWGIVAASGDDYCRVIEAELCSELQPA